MIDMKLKIVAEEFVRHANSSAAVKEFRVAQQAYNDNPELTKLRGEYATLAREFRQKESSGTLKQGDINILRTLQRKLNEHPMTIPYARAQQTMVMMLQDCNNAMSEVLGFDFAATAAPAASC